MPGLALVLLTPFLVPPAPAGADPGEDSSEVAALKSALGEVLTGLAGIDTTEAMLDPVPLTPAGLDRILSLPITLEALRGAVANASDDLESFQDDLLGGLAPADMPDIEDEDLEDLGIETLRIVAEDIDLGEGVLDLVVELERAVESPLAVLSDLVALEPDAVPVTADLTAPLTLDLDRDLTQDFDPDVDDLDIEIHLGAVTMAAQVDASFAAEGEAGSGDLDPLALNVGILGAEATGDVSGAVELQAGANGAIALDDFTTTPPRDLFSVEVATASASANLDIATELEGLEEAAGSLDFDWPPDPDDLDLAGLTGWQEAAADGLELGDLDDFRNIFLEEVVAGIGQLAVSLGAAQHSGVADVRLPLLRERTSELAHLGQGILDWLLSQQTLDEDGNVEFALAELDDEGKLRLLDELDRETLLELGLTDLQTVLDSLSEELADDPGVADLVPSYDVDEQELRFDVGWSRAASDLGLPGNDPGALRFNLSDRLQELTGLSGLVDAGDAETPASTITAEPEVTADLAVAIDLAFDELRKEFDEDYDFDLDAFIADGNDPDQLIAVGDRVQLITDGDGSSIGLDLPVTGTLDLTGSVGFLGLSASTGDDALRIESDGGGPMLSVAFEEGEPGSGRLSLDELVTSLGEAPDSVVDVDLDVAVPEFELDITAQVGETSVGGTLDLAVGWDPDAEDFDFEVDTEGLDDLLDFNFSEDPFALLDLLLQGIDRLTVDLEDRLRDGTRFGDLPLVDVDVDDLLTGLREVREQVGEIANDPDDTLQEVGERLDCLLVEAFDAGPCGDSAPTLLELDLDPGEDDGDPMTVVTRINLDVCSDGDDCLIDVPAQQPFALDLAESLPDHPVAEAVGAVAGMSSTGQLDLVFDLATSLHLGVELPSVDPGDLSAGDEDPNVVVFDSSGIRGELGIDLELDDFEVGVGPVTLQGANEEQGTVSEFRLGATFEVENLVEGGRVDLTDLGGWLGGLEATFEGTGDRECAAGIEPAEFITVSGTVSDAHTGDDLSGVTIEADNGESSTTISEDGDFDLGELPADEYTVTGSTSGYDDASATFEADAGAVVTVTLELAPEATPSATVNVEDDADDPGLRGTITDVITGAGIADAQVTAGSESTETGSDGAFDFGELDEGTYTVAASASGYEDHSTLVTIEEDEDQEVTVNLGLAPDVDSSGDADVEEAEPDEGLDERDRENEGTTGAVDACARVPLYLGDQWVGDIALVVDPLADADGALTDPQDWDLHVEERLAERLTIESLDWRLLFDGLHVVVGHVADALDGAGQGVRVPVVGEAIDGGAALAGSFESVLDELDAALDEVEDELALIEDPGELQGEIDGILRDAFDAEVFGEDADIDLDIGVELRCDGTPCDDDHNVADIDDGEVTVELSGKEQATLDAFDLGFPGLALNVEDDIVASITWGAELTFGLDPGGFYLRTQGDDGDFIDQLEVNTTVELPDELSGDLALLRVDLEKLDGEDREAYDDDFSTVDDDAEGDLDLTVTSSVHTGEDNDGKAPLHQLISQLDRDTLVLGVNADVDLRYGLETSASLPGVSGLDDAAFPTLHADLLLGWGLQTDSSQGFRLDEEGGGLPAPEVFGFRDVEVDMGDFLGGFLGPMLEEVQRFTAPFQPVIDTISAPVPGLSDLAETMGLDPITMIELFEAVDDNDLTFIKRVIGLVDLANQVDADAEGTVVSLADLGMGDFDIDVAAALEGPRSASSRGELIKDLDDIAGDFDEVLGEGGLLGLADPEDGEKPDDAIVDALPFGEEGSDHSVHRSRQGGGFSFPAYENPSQLFGLLVGENPVLARWDSGTLEAGFAKSYNFPPIFVGPVPIGFSLSAAAQIEGRFAIGYDTYGIRRAVEATRDLSDADVANHPVYGAVPMLFTGVFLDDLDEDGNQVPELVLSSEFAGSAGVSVGVITAGLELGLRALIDFDLRDPSGTGRVRIQHIIDNFHTPICLFEVGGQLDVFLEAFVKISFGIGSKTTNFTIFDILVLRMDDILEAFCGDRPPNLADVVEHGEDRVLVLNMGDERRDRRGIAPGEEDEHFVVRPLDGAGEDEEHRAFSVAAFGEYEEYTDVTGVELYDGHRVQIVADGGQGEDTIELLDGSDAERESDQIDADDEDIAPDAIPMRANAVLCGGPGDDVLVGGRGDDILVGDGSCTVTGGVVVDGEEDDGLPPGGDLEISVDLEEQHVDDPEKRGDEDDGDDRLHATAGDNLLFGLGGHDQLYGGTGSDVLVGGAGDNQLDAGEGTASNLLVGGQLLPGPDGQPLPNGADELDLLAASQVPPHPSGDDELFGGRGDDVLIGGHGGVDADFGDVWVDHVRGAGNDFLDGGPGDDRLFGSPGDDELYGGRGDDFLHGGPGDDLLVGGTTEDDGQPGNNVLVGGPGDDLLIAHDATVVRDDDGRAEDAQPIHGDADDDAVLIGGGLVDGDTIEIDDPGDDELWGAGGDDLLIGDNARPDDDDLLPTEAAGVTVFPNGLAPGAFADLADRDQHGYPVGLDPLDDHGGDDRLYGGEGDDTLFGGPGDDVLIGGWPVRTLSDGTAVARVEPGDDLLVGGRGNDQLVGDHADVEPFDEQDPETGTDVALELLPGRGTTSNRLIGGRASTEAIDGADADPGQNRLLAGAHGDVLVGDDGHITADGTTAGDRTVTVLLNIGDDDELFGGAGNDRLFGGPGDDLLRGGGGENHLEGGPGDDQIFGGAGPDILIGGNSRPAVPSGDNLLVGGPGDGALAGDNARIERTSPGDGLHGSDYLVELFDVEVTDGAVAADTAGADVLVGGSLHRDTDSNDLLFGQGGDDLMFGDRARQLAPGHPDALDRYGADVVANERWGWFVPVETGTGGDDHLDGGPGDDRMFGGPGNDTLVGGNSLRAEFDDRSEPEDDDRHLVPPPLAPGASADAVELIRRLEGVPSGDDLLVGGAGDDVLFGDNANPDSTEVETAGFTFFGLEFEPPESAPRGEFELYDVAYADLVGTDDEPDDATAGDDVLIGGVIARPHDTIPTAGGDTGFGQGGDDLLIGDHATRLPDEDDRRFAPLLLDDEGRQLPGGEDHLEGGPGDDALFGGPGDDTLIGGTSDLAVHDAGVRGVAAGDDLLVGGPGRDMMLGDNGRVLVEPSGDADLPSWWANGLAGAAVDPFDEHLLDEDGEPVVPDHTFGDDLLIGGSLRGDDPGLEDLDQDGTEPGDDLMHGQGGDDAMFGDDVVVEATDWAGDSGARAWQTLRRDLAAAADEHTDEWPLASLEVDADGEPATGGDDLMLGGPGDDIMFGGPGQDDMIGGSWDEGRLDGRDQMDAGPGHDVAAGDNARITRPVVHDLEGLEDGRLLCQTYRHLEESELDDAGQQARLDLWRDLTDGHVEHEEFGLVSDCLLGEPDPEEDDGLATRVVREVEMLDGAPEEGEAPPTAGSDLIWGGDGDNTIIGQFDDTADFKAADPEADPFLPDDDSPWQGWDAERVVEWCRVDDAFASLLEDDESRDAFDGLAGEHLDRLEGIAGEEGYAAALAAYVGIYQGDDPEEGYDLAQIAFAGDVLCGGPGEDTILGDQGIVTDIVEDGSREEVIEPQQPFVSETRFREGTRTRQVELTDLTTFDHFERNVGGDDLILGGSGGDAIHGGAGDSIINGNAGDNYIFGGDGDDVIWGGRGDDHLYSGYGDTYLDVRPRPATDGFDGDPPAWFLIGVEADTYQGVDEIYGGWGQDVLQADEASEGPNEEDRLMAWAGAHNLHYVCASTYGAWVSIRNIEPGLLDYLIDKAEGHGAYRPGTDGESGFRELALVYNRDMRHNANPPHPETPGNFTCGAADPAD